MFLHCSVVPSHLHFRNVLALQRDEQDPVYVLTSADVCMKQKDATCNRNEAYLTVILL